VARRPTRIKAVGLALFARLWFVLLIALSFSFVASHLKHIDRIAAISTLPEIVYEFALLVAAALLFAAVGAVAATALAAPFLLKSARPELLAHRIGAFAAVAALFVCALVGALHALIWFRSVAGWPPSLSLARIATVVLVLGAASATAVLRAPRRKVMRYAGEVFCNRTTRRAALAGGIAGLGLTALGYDPVRRLSRPRRGPVRGSRTNIVVVTFDACAADQTSLGGCAVRPTPHLERFAESAVVFGQAIATSTFTSSTAASLLTGRFPSEHLVYDLDGRLHGTDLDRTLPRLLRQNGYFTAASVANPHAHPLQAFGMMGDFDCLPPPPIRSLALTFPEREFLMVDEAADATDLMQGIVRQIFVSPVEELGYALGGAAEHSEFPPEWSFAQGLRLLARCRASQQPFFLWIHLHAPHDPYLPSPPFLNRYVRDGRHVPAPSKFAVLPDNRFAPRHRGEVERMRLRYCEWLAHADAAFGEFLAQATPMLDDTAMIVSADHGESFDGTLTHDSPHHMRGEIHIPLVVRLPGAHAARRIDSVVSQAAIAPTILDICGLDRPHWMSLPSLLAAERPENAFSQYFSGNSPFHPVSKGTISGVDGRYQYVYDLAAKRGKLRRWNAAGEIDADRTAEAPDAAGRLRAALAARFPEFTVGSA
jgi:arylsulfatase A-like enzyme